MGFFYDKKNNLAIYEAPKTGGTTLRMWIGFYLTGKIFSNSEELKREEYYTGNRKLTNLLKDNGYSWEKFTESDAKYKICILRNPTSRFISCYRDKASKLSPSLEDFIQNFDNYMKADQEYVERYGLPMLEFHFRPQTYFYGNEISYYTHIFRKRQISTKLKEFLESVWGIELPDLHARNSKTNSIQAELNKKDKAKIAKMYKSDYELISSFKKFKANKANEKRLKRSSIALTINKKFPQKSSGLIWCAWLEGESHKDLPRVNYECLKQWKKLNPKSELVIITNQNIDRYIPEYNRIVSRLTHERDSCAKSNLIRLLLLEKYGGSWVDASVFPMIPIAEIITQTINTTGFFTYRFFPRSISENRRVGDRECVSWFIHASNPNSNIIKNWKEEFYDLFFSKNYRFHDMHQALCNAYDTNKSTESTINLMTQIDQKIPHSCMNNNLKYEVNNNHEFDELDFASTRSSFMYKRPRGINTLKQISAIWTNTLASNKSTKDAKEEPSDSQYNLKEKYRSKSQLLYAMKTGEPLINLLS